MAKKLYIETHGCQMNEYDSSRMVDLLGEHQALEVTARAEDADVILLNTCSIRERAQDRVYSQLGRWRELKLANPDMVIAVGGCVASQEGAAIRDRAPLCRRGLRPANPAPLAGNDRRGAYHQAAAGRCVVP